MKDKEHGLGTQPISTLVWKLSIPSIIAMLANALYSVVDRVFIGQGVNELAIGGVYLIMPIQMIIMSVQMLASSGGSTLMSISLGEKNKDKAEKYLNISIYLLIIFAIFIPIILFIFKEQIINLLGPTESNYKYAATYFDYTIPGIPAILIGFGLNNFIRAAGDSRAAMTTILIGVFLNIILDPIFIFALDMGVKGAAIATVISQYVSMIWVLMYFIKDKHILKLSKHYMKLEGKLVGDIFENGLPLFLINVANSFLMMFINLNLKRYAGATGLSAMSIVMGISSVLFMPLYGINQGIHPIIAYNYGAKSFDRVKEAYLKGTIYASIVSVTAFLAIMIWPYEMCSIFFNEKTGPVLELAASGLKKSMYASPFLGISIAGTAFFQAVKRPRTASITSLLRQFIILLPLIYILPLFYGIDGFWWAYTVSDVLSSIIVFFAVIKIMKQVKMECLANNNLGENKNERI